MAFRIHVKKKKKKVRYDFIILLLRKQRQADPSGLLASQSSLLGQFQESMHVPKHTKHTHTHTCAHAHTYTNMHVLTLNRAASPGRPVAKHASERNVYTICLSMLVGALIKVTC